jgi:hypothetical protein
VTATKNTIFAWPRLASAKRSRIKLQFLALATRCAGALPLWVRVSHDALAVDGPESPRLRNQEGGPLISVPRQVLPFNGLPTTREMMWRSTLSCQRDVPKSRQLSAARGAVGRRPSEHRVKLVALRCTRIAASRLHDGCGVLKLQRRQFLHLAAGAVAGATALQRRARALELSRPAGALDRANGARRHARCLARLLCLVSRFEGNHAGCTLRELW